MFHKVLLAVSALLCVGASGLAIFAQDPKDAPKEDPKPATGDGITRKEVPEDYAAKVAPDLADAKLLAAGKKEFASDCAKCHGDAGAGKPDSKLDPKPTNLTTPEFHDTVTDQYIFWRIKTGAASYGGEGKSKMKAAGKSAKDEEIWELVAFVRSLKAEKIEILDSVRFGELMQDIKSSWGSLGRNAKARDAEKTGADAAELVKHARGIMGYDANVSEGKKVRDQDDFKKFAEDFRKSAEEYAAFVKAADWKGADDKQATIGDGCSNCHDMYKNKR